MRRRRPHSASDTAKAASMHSGSGVLGGKLSTIANDVSAVLPTLVVALAQTCYRPFSCWTSFFFFTSGRLHTPSIFTKFQPGIQINRDVSDFDSSLVLLKTAPNSFSSFAARAAGYPLRSWSLLLADPVCLTPKQQIRQKALLIHPLVQGTTRGRTSVVAWGNTFSSILNLYWKCGQKARVC